MLVFISNMSSMFSSEIYQSGILYTVSCLCSPVFHDRNLELSQPDTNWVIRIYMMTSSNGNIFRVTGHLCGEFTGPRWIPRTKASDARLWCFFDLRLNKRLSKQSWGLCSPVFHDRNLELSQPDTNWGIRISMMTSSNGNIFRVTGHLCGESTGPRWIPRTKASDAELWCFFNLCLNKRLSKQSWGWWFETLSRPLWRHRNDQKRRQLSTEILFSLQCQCNIHKSPAWGMSLLEVVQS